MYCVINAKNNNIQKKQHCNFHFGRILNGETQTTTTKTTKLSKIFVTLQNFLCHS